MLPAMSPDRNQGLKKLQTMSDDTA